VKYSRQINQLKSEFADQIPGSSTETGTYSDQDPAVPEDLRGVIAIQYTPYDHDGGSDGCTPQARVRVFYENHQTAVIDKSWDSRSNQINNKRRRQAC